jgi:hypothetical protein
MLAADSQLIPHTGDGRYVPGDLFHAFPRRDAGDPALQYHVAVLDRDVDTVPTSLGGTRQRRRHQGA